MARKKATVESADSKLSHAIRQCVDAGKVEFGTKTSIKRALSGKAKLLVVASNCPAITFQDISRFCKLSGIPSIVFNGTSLELGTIAGRPHSITVLAVYDVGNSGILELAKQ